MAHSLVSVFKKVTKNSIKHVSIRVIEHLLSTSVKYDSRKGNSEPAFTLDFTDVQIVSHGALAAESAVYVDALAIDAGIIEAFINIYNNKNINTNLITSSTIP